MNPSFLTYNLGRPMTHQSFARLMILATAVLFSTGGAAIKASSFSSWQIAGLRSGIAAVALALLLPTSRKRWSWSILAVGSAYAATMILFVQANKLTTAANTIFLQSTAPLYILLLGPWLLREPVRRRDLMFMGVVGLGMLAFFLGTELPVATAPKPVQGNILAVLCGFCWAMTVMGLRWMERGPGDSSPGRAAAAVVCGNALAFLVALPAALPMPDGQLTDWAVAVYLGVFQIGVAYVLLTKAIRHLQALEASLLLLLEPVLSPVWAWWIHGEEPGPWSLLGGAVILVATAVKSRLDLGGWRPPGPGSTTGRAGSDSSTLP